MVANKLTPTEIKPQSTSNKINTNSENEDIAGKKRKRKSRWANDNIAVPVIPPINIIPAVIPRQTVPQPINVHKLGNFNN